MKKLLILLAFIVVATISYAQVFTGKVDLGATWTAKSLGSFMLTDTATLEVTVTLNSHTPFTFDVGMAMDNISGNPGGILYVLGRKATTGAWVAIANTTWSSIDGTVIVSHVTPVRYRQILVRFVSSGTGITEADNYWVKLWSE